MQQHELTYVKMIESAGTGKSFLALAIGNQAYLLDCKVYYANTARQLSQPKMLKEDVVPL